MIIGVPAETTEGETRVATIPPVAEDLVEEGHEVLVESGAGEGSDWSDEEYEDVGCEIAADPAEIYEEADVVFHVQALGNLDDPAPERYAEDQIVVGLLGPYGVDDATLETLADEGVTAFALELIPRISRAQSMDALSSMASIGGYKAAVMAADDLPELFPMQMTAAGTVRPADVFVVGAGVAGLQAIATAERLGANVRAYDIRPEVKEEVESLGADFVELDLETDDASDEEGHAREQDEEFYRKQREMMVDVVGDSDVVITTAAVPGGEAPELVTNEMLDGMDPGSVVVDLAAPGGGNCEPTEADEIVDYGGVRIHGPTNLPARVAHTASQLYSNNLTHFLDAITDDEGALAIDLEDEIVDSTMLVGNGEVRKPHEQDEEDGEETDDAGAEADDEDESEVDESGDEDEAATDGGAPAADGDAAHDAGDAGEEAEP